MRFKFTEEIIALSVIAGYMAGKEKKINNSLSSRTQLSQIQKVEIGCEII